MATPSPPPANAAASPTVEDGAEFQNAEVPLDTLMRLLHARFAFTSEYSTSKERDAARQSIIDAINEKKMSAYYRAINAVVAHKLPDATLAQWDKEHEATVAALDATVKDAEENLGDVEVRDALLAKAEHYATIGDLEKFLATAKATGEKSIAVGPKIDLCFQRVRLGLAFSDHAVVTAALEEANELMKRGDWERRNRLKVYEGLFNVYVRNFAKGSRLLLDAATTFAATELLSFRDYIFVTAVAALATLGRKELRESMVDSPEVLAANIPEVNDLVAALYKCRYGDIFTSLAAMCTSMRRSVFVTSHVNYFFREVRVKAFNQFLDSYSSVTIKSMAAAFGLPVNVLDQMLYTLISNERLSCKMDRVSGNVLTYRGDRISYHYHRVVKEGDMLLNKIQRLSRIVEQ